MTERTRALYEEAILKYGSDHDKEKSKYWPQGFAHEVEHKQYQQQARFFLQKDFEKDCKRTVIATTAIPDGAVW